MLQFLEYLNYVPGYFMRAVKLIKEVHMARRFNAQSWEYQLHWLKCTTNGNLQVMNMM